MEKTVNNLTKKERIRGLTVVIAIVTVILLLGTGFAIVIVSAFN